MPVKRRRGLSARKIARERVRRLWELAQKKAKTEPQLARHHMRVARKVSRRVREGLPRDIARRLCKKCGTVLIPGHNCRVRVRGNRETHVTVTCLECGAIRRFPVRRQR